MAKACGGGAPNILLGRHHRESRLLQVPRVTRISCRMRRREGSPVGQGASKALGVHARTIAPRGQETHEADFYNL